MKTLLLPLVFGLASLLGPAAGAQDGAAAGGSAPAKEAAHPAEKSDSAFPSAVDAATLKQTIVTAHLRETQVAGKNILWCDTFQLAWDVLAQAYGGSIHLSDEPAMAKVLNEHLASSADIDEPSYLAMAGFIRDGIVGKIMKSLDAKFPDHDDFLKKVLEEAKLDREDLLAFAYLHKDLAFETPFYARTKKPLQFGTQEVKSFGVWWEKDIADQDKRTREVQVIDYRDEKDFAVELLTKSSGDRLILAQLKPGATLKDTVDEVLKRVAAAKPQSISESDVFLAPSLKLNILRSYEEIIGHTFNKGEMVIDKALQATQFKLDENGAILTSQAVIIAKPTGRPAEPRRFVFDQPFLVMMMRKDAKTPYFALWIANTELLTPFASESSPAMDDPAKPTNLPIRRPLTRPVTPLPTPLPAQ